MRKEKIESRLINLIDVAAKSVLADLGRQAEVVAALEIPKDISHGDISTNVAMRLAKAASKPPVQLAELIKSKMEGSLASASLSGDIDRIEVKQPGFINFILSSKYLAGVLGDIKDHPDQYGRSDIGKGQKLQIEFVSANPTGPLTIAHGRQAAIGDSLANILQFIGYDVTREYYLNDEGTQMDILGRSIRHRYREIFGNKEEFPQDHYKGAYIMDIAKDFRKKYGDKHVSDNDSDVFRRFGLEWILNDIKKDLKDFGVNFDSWYSQCKLRESGKVDEAIEYLRSKGYIFESEGAVWFRSTDFGDDKDRVVIKSDGSKTYLAPDIAYHREKFKKGFSRLIDIWGPDHHGYIPRMKAAIQALGHDERSLSVLIVQLATLYRAGQQVSMSTRAGEFVTLREVMDEVGKDVARFCFIMRRISSHLDFDIDAVKKESAENPVYYIQYAHARICSIRKHSEDREVSGSFDPSLLKEEEERLLMRLLRQFPTIVTMSGNQLEPYVVLQYLQDLATAFHSLYNKHRVVSDDNNLSVARLVLVDCVRIVIGSGLKLLGVSLPEKM